MTAAEKVREGIVSAKETAKKPANVPALKTSGGKDIQSLLKSPEMLDRFRSVIPTHLNPQRMLRVMALAVHKTPKLAQCDSMSLLGSMMVCASLGIEPNTPMGHAYLIPFDKKRKDGEQWVYVRTEVNLVIGYRGFIDLARRSGNLTSIHADVIYEGDEFSFEYGSNMHLRHVPHGAREGRKPLWAYAFAKLSDGEAFDVLPYEEVLAVRNGSEAYKMALRNKGKADSPSQTYLTSPWVAHEHEMASKTMIRRLSKKLPLSIEFANAAALDSMSEAGKVNYSTFAIDENALTDVETAKIAYEGEYTVQEPPAEPQATEPEAPPASPKKAKAITLYLSGGEIVDLASPDLYVARLKQEVELDQNVWFMAENEATRKNLTAEQPELEARFNAIEAVISSEDFGI